MEALLTFSYWFNSYPSPFVGLVYWVLVGVVGVGIVGGLALKFLSPRLVDGSHRRMLNKLSSLLITMGVLVAFSFFFTQTTTPVLGSRFWFGLWLIIGLIWLWFIVRYAWAIAPSERAARLREQERLKYLPRSSRV